MLFKKVVSNLPFSPALVGQLGFYAKRLKKEQATRRLGMLFTALALIVQSFALLNPPEPVLASNPNNIIFSGINSKQDLLNAWDRNSDGHGHKDIQQIFKFFLGSDFSRNDLEKAKKGSFGSRDKVNGGKILSLGRTQQTSDPAQKAHTIRDASGNKSTIWSRHLSAFDSGANKSGRGSMYEAFIGSHNGKWFAIIFDCGNLAFSDTIKVPTVTPQLTVKATCREVTGYAYDRSNLKASLKVYLYIDGGEKIGTTANLSTPGDGVSGNHGFKFTVPAKYHTGKKYSYTVAATPAYPENHTAQYRGVIDTTTCKPKTPTPPPLTPTPPTPTPPTPTPNPTPVARCDALQFTRVQNKRDTFTLTAKAYTQDGATVSSYRYAVGDKNNVVKFSKTYASAQLTHTTEDIVLSDAGDYTATVAVVTSLGEKTGTECTKTLTVTPPEKCVYNPELPVGHADCKPCPGDETIWIKDAQCNPEIVQLKFVKNLTKGLDDANGTTVSPGDRLQYELRVENVGKMATTLNLDEDLSDVLEYATLTDFGSNANSTFNAENGTLTWKNITLEPGQKVNKVITVSVKDQIPSTPKSVGNPESYDCQMGNVFGGSSVTVKVQCPTEKVVESTVESLPQTGTGANIIFSTFLILIVTYFYMRSRQMNKELGMIKKEFNAGAA